MNYVLVVNVGPVQGFIATARKTRDLWFGSWLLSELSKRTAEVIQKECGGKIIAPAAGAGSEGMMVNRITAVLDESGLKALEDAFPERLRVRLGEEWSHIGKFGDLDPNVDAKAQLDDLPECVWAAVPIMSDYKTARDEAERMLAARKTTRDFAPVRWGAAKAKSSLDGVRESVIPESVYAPANAGPDEQQRRQDNLYRKYKAGPAERLSAVDLLKRHGGGERPVASTSHMAALPLVMRMAADPSKVQAEMKRLLDSLKEANADLQSLENTGQSFEIVDNFDASFLYESRLKEDPLGRPLPKEKAEAATNALRTFYKALGPGWSPPPYYALLMADGDNMGVVVDAQETEEEHKALSMALSAFAVSANEIVGSPEYMGLPVYAGGDDVLALLPVHTAVACARKLHDEFHEALKAFSAADAQHNQVLPSLSVGIVIAHHLEPLSEVLRLGHAAEGAAKGISGKDALAVTLAKRSGANRTIAGRWDSGIGQRLTDFADLHLADAVPDGAAYELQELHHRLSSIGKSDDAQSREQDRSTLDTLEAFTRAEASRIVERKMAEHGARPVAREIKNRLQSELESAPDIEQVALELMVAAEIANACAVAGLSTLPTLGVETQPSPTENNAAEAATGEATDA